MTLLDLDPKLNPLFDHYQVFKPSPLEAEATKLMTKVLWDSAALTVSHFLYDRFLLERVFGKGLRV